MKISVVIPTCNRKQKLLFLLENLDRSIYPLLEVIIVDSGEEPLSPADYSPFNNLRILCLPSEKSVCIQRNIGIQRAQGDWIFLCDDDMGIPADYLQKLVDHSNAYGNAGALSGLVLQELEKEWQFSYPVSSPWLLLWSYIFQLSIWGKIQVTRAHAFIKPIRQYYLRKGNHISKAGWPVVTDFSGDYFSTPVYGLGASLIRKKWLLNAPFDEVLDKHGIGDNYGVALQFPVPGIHVVSNAFVYHHRGPVNRIDKPLQYYRRALALDYFRKTKKTPAYVKKYWLIWSLAGNFLGFMLVWDRMMFGVALKSLWKVMLGHNPYYRAAQVNRKVEEPLL